MVSLSIGACSGEIGGRTIDASDGASQTDGGESDTPVDAQADVGTRTPIGCGGCLGSGRPALSPLSEMRGYGHDIFSDREFDTVAFVTNGNDDGPGSLRDALQSGADIVTILYGGEIALESGDVFVHDQWLDGAFAPAPPRIRGRGHSLRVRGRALLTDVKASREGGDGDALEPSVGSDLFVVANCSFALGTDETLDLVTQFDDGQAAIFQTLVYDAARPNPRLLQLDGNHQLSMERSVGAGYYEQRNPLARSRYMVFTDNVFGPRGTGGTHVQLTHNSPVAGTYVRHDTYFENNVFVRGVGDPRHVFRDDQTPGIYDDQTVRSTRIYLGPGNFGIDARGDVYGRGSGMDGLFTLSEPIGNDTGAFVARTETNPIPAAARPACLPDGVVPIVSTNVVTHRDDIVRTVGAHRWRRDDRDARALVDLVNNIVPSEAQRHADYVNPGDGTVATIFDGIDAETLISTPTEGSRFEAREVGVVEADGCHTLYELLREAYVDSRM